MAHVELSRHLQEDFDRIVEHWQRHEMADRAVRMEEIIQGISALEYNPLIGRPARNDLRELVMGRGSHGYVALYRYIQEIDTVFVLAIRSQREAGYQRT